MIRAEPCRGDIEVWTRACVSKQSNNLLFKIGGRPGHPNFYLFWVLLLIADILCRLLLASSEKHKYMLLCI